MKTVCYKSKLSFLQSDFGPNGVNSCFEEGKVVLEPYLFVLDDADEFDELVIFLFLLADVLLPC